MVSLIEKIKHHAEKCLIPMVFLARYKQNLKFLLEQVSRVIKIHKKISKIDTKIRLVIIEK